MLIRIVALSGLVLLAATPSPASASTAPASRAAEVGTANNAAYAPIGQWIDAMNAGDPKTAAAASVPNPVIIDEFGSHCWHSFDAWNGDFGEFRKKGSVTDFRIAASSPSFKSADAQAAYAVVPAILSYKVKGKETLEKGIFTFALANTPDGWRISGWAWARQ